MITALIAITQSMAPILPPGASVEFHTQVLAIERMLEAGEFDQASARLKDMPSKEVEIAWNEASIPAGERAAFAQARDLALTTWKVFAPDLTFSVKPSGKLAFNFVPSIEKTSPETPLTQGMAVSIERPQSQAVIGLKRGDKGVATSANNVHNDVARAIGNYLGLVDSPFASTAMYPIHWESNRVMLMRQDADAALANLRVLDSLRTAAAERRKITPTQAKVVIGESYSMGRMLNGDKKQFKVEVRNEGNGPLNLWVRSDCGCTTVQGPQQVAPGEAKFLDVNFDSTEFDGDVTKRLILVTNDAVQPVRTFKISGNIQPAYRFLAPSGPVVVLDEKGGRAELYLTFKDIEPFGIRAAGLTGLNGTVTYAPWQGELPDPARGEGATARKGYKFTVDFGKQTLFGRMPGTLIVMTNSPSLPRVQFTLNAQTGIVSLPGDLYLGEVSEPKTAKLLVSRPGRPFKVTGVESQSPAFKVTYKAVSADEYALEVVYDGKAPKGDLATSLKVKTDDPKQPVVHIPILGTVR
jgi:hypothetical protein